MLSHSPPFPLIIDHNHPNHELNAEDEEGIILALQHRDRVRRIRLLMPLPSLQKFIVAIDGKFPVLEFLSIGPLTKHDTRLTLSSTFEAPHLSHLLLDHFASPIGSPLLTNAVSLVTLLLRWTHPCTYLHPDYFLQPLSSLPQLETLQIGFSSPIPSRDFERQLLHVPIITHVTLPNLRKFVYRGITAFLEALLPCMTTPLVKMFKVHFFEQLSFSIPSLLPFMRNLKNLLFINATFLFHRRAVSVFVYPHMGSGTANFYIDIMCEHLDWQVSSVAQIFNLLDPLFSMVVDISLDCKEYNVSSGWHNQVDRVQWRKLLASFRNVRTLRVHDDLAAQLSHSLRLNGEPPLELLPELKQLICPVWSVDDRTFAEFIHEREVASHPVNLIGEKFPVGRFYYRFHSSAGVYYVDADPIQ